MRITPELLAAYADGELDAAAAREVEAGIAGDTQLQSQLAAHHALKAKLAAHFAPIAAQAVPDRLKRILAREAGAETVVDFTGASEKLREKRSPQRWVWFVGPALAASLVMAFLTFGGNTPDYAESDLARALESQLVASQSREGPVRILVSFQDRDGHYCRGFAQAPKAGIACRDDRGWRLRKLIDGGSAEKREYRQAGSGEAEVLSAVQEMAIGPALDAAGETDAARHGWRRPSERE